MKILLCAALLLEAASIAPLFAQDAPLVLETGKELLENADLFVGRSVAVSDGYCFYDQPNFVCIGNETPFEVKSTTMPDGPIKKAIVDKCGDIAGVEHNPTPQCAYSFRFVPRSFKLGIGDYVLHDEVQSNKRLTYFQAETIEALPR